jgi:hypothetical protein
MVLFLLCVRCLCKTANGLIRKISTQKRGVRPAFQAFHLSQKADDRLVKQPVEVFAASPEASTQAVTT